MTQIERFQLLGENELVPPGKCACCGAATGRQFVDFKFTLDWYGAVYLCDFCFTDAANELGFASPERVQSLEHVNATLEKAYSDLEEENGHLRNGLAALNLLPRSSNNGDWNGDSHHQEHAPELQPELPSKSSEPKRNNSRFKRNKSGPIESSNEQGPANLLDSDSPASIAESI